MDGCAHVQASSGGTVQVHDVKKAAGGQLYVHRCSVESGVVAASDSVSALVDECFRRRTRANHTATHLLQAALKQVLGEGVAQQGSLVRDAGLRFDFNLPRPMTPDEICAVEALVNQWIEVCCTCKTVD
jgi:alanyl-tRNA synthetase